MNVKVIFKAKDIVKALNTGIDNKKKDCKEWCLKYQWELPVIIKERQEK